MVTDVEQGMMDPFVELAPSRVPDRPRLLSYVGRWGRTRRWLPADAMRILDIGCSYGYGSAAIVARAPAGRSVIGIERDPDHLEHAARAFPDLRIITADATALPVVDACVDTAVLNDVVEHISSPERVLAEVRRILRPGGTVIVSVPHKGPTRWLDGLNIYSSLRARWPKLPPLPAANESDGGPHRHYTVAEIADLLGPGFRIDRVARTGLGLQELVLIAILLLGAPLRAPKLASVALAVHFLIYIIDDALPTGPLAYHLAVRARKEGHD